MQVDQIYSKFSDMLNVLFDNTTHDTQLMKHYRVMANILDVDNEDIIKAETKLFVWLKSRFNKLKKSGKMEQISKEKQYFKTKNDCQGLTVECAIKKKMKSTCDEILNDLVQFKSFRKKNAEEFDAFKKEIENLRSNNEFSDLITKWKDITEIDLTKISKTPILLVVDGEIQSNFDPEWTVLLKEYLTFKKIVENHNDGSLSIGRGYDFKDEDRNLASKISKSTMENFNKCFKFIKTISDLNLILVESIKILKAVSEQVDD